MRSLLDDLRADAPVTIHEDLAGRAITFGAAPGLLRWLAESVQPTWRTLETGCGISTIVFAQAGSEHVTVAPFASEGERVRAWCADHGVGTDRVRFVVERAEDVLPTMDLGELDLVLIDGSHSFPHVFLDWFYTARALKTGGLLVVDDTNLWTGSVLRDYLAEDPGWRLVREWRYRVAVFQKVASVDLGAAWNEQPFVAKRSATIRGNKTRAVLHLARSGKFAFLYWRTRSRLQERRIRG